MHHRLGATGLLSIALLSVAGCALAGCIDVGADDAAGRRETSGIEANVPSTRASVPRPASDIAWEPCGDTDKGECATIQVPIDWGHPEGEKLDLAIGRVPALEPENRIGVLFLNPGGPGSSGIDAYITGREIPDSSVLRKRFDVVSWDPRGVARSHPIVCSVDLLDRYLWSFPRTEQQYRERLAYNAKLGDDCRAHTGPLFDHVDTLSTVRDMDAIRAALGEEKLSYYGVSYGTLIGEQYAEKFPKRIRAMTLDSVIDHSITSDFRYLQTNTEDLEKSFLAFIDWCGRTPACKLHGRDIAGLWDALYEKASTGTLVDPATGNPMDLESLRIILQKPLAGPTAARWFGLAQRLASLETGTPPAASARAAFDDQVMEFSYLPTLCEDWKFRTGNFQELDGYRRALEAMYPHTRMTVFWTDIADCLGFPVQVGNPQHRLSAPDAPPILIATSRHDVAAPHDWALAVHRQMKSSVLLQYDGIGHGQFSRSTCARQYIETYMTTLVAPPENTHCDAVWPTAESSAEEAEPARFLPAPALRPRR